MKKYNMAPIFFDYQRTPLSLKKTKIALDNLNTYFNRLGTKYAAGGKLYKNLPYFIGKGYIHSLPPY
ncbi:hypothetical protein NQ314_011909 [Rhamnusium bicolor]|uniref:Uncharacterized protein n=1 Tax=Rhamnusium bicolor TaxID=1586634 RepID=A0AAV8XFG0_9CUCU|nr:hypothetical protein NQ314_011909 [Rhamnusium bicolor]